MGAPEPFTATADVGHHIAGAVTPGTGSRRQAVYNPATGAVARQVVLGSEADVAAAVAAA
ncbi:MAG TPA: methylmalonate-semialdehyde dehydrogenase (CoA acylating), partial [Ramlibacter sp.]|nr:methylmalonate-semialdehyde dehydrogenase (CoA acylating) [Ramlibacter sp.]